MCKSLKLTKLYHSSKIEKEKTEKNRFSFLALLCIKCFECRVSRALNKTGFVYRLSCGKCNKKRYKHEKFTRKKCWKMFLEAISSHSRKLSPKFLYKIFVTALHDINGLQNSSLPFCKS